MDQQALLAAALKADPATQICPLCNDERHRHDIRRGETRLRCKSGALCPLPSAAEIERAKKAATGLSPAAKRSCPSCGVRHVADAACFRRAESGVK